ncbi:MAG: hypothetical protein HW384_2189 [Dehalococcoidia bacterium]|nr:hypothetical protein [Dehalococcoidia bacterium]
MRLYSITEREVESVLTEGKVQPDPKSRDKAGLFSILKLEEKTFKVAFARQGDEIFVKTVYPLRKYNGEE